MKVLGWIGKHIFMAGFVCVLTVTLTLVVVNIHTQQLLAGLGIQLEDANLTYSEVLAHLSGKNRNINQVQLNKGFIAGAAPSVDDIVEVPDEAVEVWNQMNLNHHEQFDSSNHVEDALVLSLEDFNLKKDALTSEDKMKVFSIVIANVPAEEVQKLSHMMEDGITQEELEEINVMMALYLSDEDAEELMNILKRVDEM